MGKNMNICKYNIHILAVDAVYALPKEGGDLTYVIGQTRSSRVIPGIKRASHYKLLPT